MEKGVMDFMAGLRESFGLEEVDIRTYSPLVLAYIGDVVYELVIRSLLVGKGNAQVNRLHRRASSLVNAAAQSAAFERIREELTEEELHVFRRGRNANSATMAKHATMTDYRRATGFEALMGYLYLTGQTERIYTLVRLGFEEGVWETES
ncbi:MAG TPA: ribonuclease III [Candidatus Merdisoma merdipullorum]|nr:ribonuclease III [Candidatus Merdisoma merdipullorum]